MKCAVSYRSPKLNTIKLKALTVSSVGFLASWNAERAPALLEPPPAMDTLNESPALSPGGISAEKTPVPWWN